MIPLMRDYVNLLEGKGPDSIAVSIFVVISDDFYKSEVCLKEALLLKSWKFLDIFDQKKRSRFMIKYDLIWPNVTKYMTIGPNL